MIWPIKRSAPANDFFCPMPYANLIFYKYHSKKDSEISKKKKKKRKRKKQKTPSRCTKLYQHNNGHDNAKHCYFVYGKKVTIRVKRPLTCFKKGHYKLSHKAVRWFWEQNTRLTFFFLSLSLSFSVSTTCYKP